MLALKRGCRERAHDMRCASRQIFRTRAGSQRLKMEAEAEDSKIMQEAAIKNKEEQRKRKAEDALDDRYDENGNFKSYSFQLPVKQQKQKPKMNFSWMKK